MAQMSVNFHNVVLAMLMSLRVGIGYDGAFLFTWHLLHISIFQGRVVSTLAGGCNPAAIIDGGGCTGKQGYADGLGTETAFNYPARLVSDMEGNIYIADTANHVVRKVTSPYKFVFRMAYHDCFQGTLELLYRAYACNAPYNSCDGVSWNVSSTEMATSLL